MLIYSDRITNDEVLSDALMPKELDGGILEVETTRIVVGGGEVDIGCGNEFGGGGGDEEVDDAQETVLNIVANHELKTIEYTKKEYKTMMKMYWKNLKEKLEAAVESADSDWEKDQAKAAFKSFKTNFPALKEFVKEVVVANYDEFEFYTSESMNPEGIIIPARYIGESITPTFYFFKDGLNEEKA